MLACAALLPDLVTAAAALGSYAPFDADGLDWFNGMAPGVPDAYRLALTNPNAARAVLDEAREADLATPASALAELFADFLSAADAAALTDELAVYITHSTMKRSVRAARDGGMTAAPSSTSGGSNWPTSPCQYCSCTAGRTSSSPTLTANGSPPTSPASKPGCSKPTGISRFSSTASAKCTPG